MCTESKNVVSVGMTKRTGWFISLLLDDMPIGLLYCDCSGNSLLSDDWRLMPNDALGDAAVAVLLFFEDEDVPNV